MLILEISYLHALCYNIYVIFIVIIRSLGPRFIVSHRASGFAGTALGVRLLFAISIFLDEHSSRGKQSRDTTSAFSCSPFFLSISRQDLQLIDLPAATAACHAYPAHGCEWVRSAFTSPQRGRETRSAGRRGRVRHAAPG